jgi:hypothetical protein
MHHKPLKELRENWLTEVKPMEFGRKACLKWSEETGRTAVLLKK